MYSIYLSVLFPFLPCNLSSEPWMSSRMRDGGLMKDGCGARQTYDLQVISYDVEARILRV
jgi:hypothetical protein